MSCLSELEEKYGIPEDCILELVERGSVSDSCPEAFRELLRSVLDDEIELQLEKLRLLRESGELTEEDVEKVAEELACRLIESLDWSLYPAQKASETLSLNRELVKSLVLRMASLLKDPNVREELKEWLKEALKSGELRLPDNVELPEELKKELEELLQDEEFRQAIEELSRELREISEELAEAYGPMYGEDEEVKEQLEEEVLDDVAEKLADAVSQSAVSLAKSVADDLRESVQQNANTRLLAKSLPPELAEAVEKNPERASKVLRLLDVTRSVDFEVLFGLVDASLRKYVHTVRRVQSLSELTRMLPVHYSYISAVRLVRDKRLKRALKAWAVHRLMSAEVFEFSPAYSIHIYIDISPSMEDEIWPGVEKLDLASALVLAFLERYQHKHDISVHAFCGYDDVIDVSRDELWEFLLSAETCNYTNIRAVLQHILEKTQPGDVSVVLTDGMHNVGPLPPELAEKVARSRSVVFIVLPPGDPDAYYLKPFLVLVFDEESRRLKLYRHPTTSP